jgi:hypothetical protein
MASLLALPAGASCALLPPRPAPRTRRTAAAAAAARAPLPLLRRSLAVRRGAPGPPSPRERGGRAPAATPERGEGDKPKSEEEERVYDEDGLYIGTYSNFFSDPSQLRGVVIFCAVLASFFSLGNVGAAIVLPILCVTLRAAGAACWRARGCWLVALPRRRLLTAAWGVRSRYNRPIQLCFEAIVFGYPCA